MGDDGASSLAAVDVHLRTDEWTDAHALLVPWIFSPGTLIPTIPRTCNKSEGMSLFNLLSTNLSRPTYARS